MKRQGICFLLVTLSFFLPLLSGQSIQLSSVNVDKSSPLNKIFFDFKLVRIQYDQLKSAVSTRGNEHFIHLQSQDLDWNLEMFDHDIYTSDFIQRLGTDHGVETLHRRPANKPMIGYLKSARGGQARLVVADNYIAGMIEEGGAKFFIEPANGMDPLLPADYLIIYNTDNIIQNTNIQCGFDLYKNNQKNIEEQTKEIQISDRSHCLQVEVGISNDYTIFQKRGSEAAVENWNTTILTLMQDNYDNEFQHSLELVQSVSFVALSPSGDPWNGISDIGSQLDKHQSWGSGGGYGGNYDVATNWSAKWTSGAVGLAWVAVVCTNLKYNVCSDYGGSNSCVRQLEAHEMGHNFGCSHDGSGQPYIMAPAVNCTSVWSGASVSAVNQHINTRSCLSICSGGSAPVADFYATPTEKCVPFTVQFVDLSSNDPTAWQWTFPGATPSTATVKNPTGIQYKTYGMYDVTLKVSNAYGSNTVTFKKYIFAKEKPVATFNKTIIERTAYLTNTSIYATSVEWDFGDGEISNDENPVHIYADDGVYTIILRAENECGISETKMKITIVTSPIALFSADTTSGCAVFKVKYINLSSKNVTSWAWDFPGGTPSTSSLFEPIVEYKSHGVFDVRLTAKNSKYSALAVKLKYITVDSSPVAVFDTSVNGGEVKFTNKAIFAKSWIWDFGDGNTSIELNPSHGYNPGTYQAKLTVNNSCGSQTLIKQIIISGALHVGFNIDKPNGCVPFTVHYNNTSFGTNFYLWSFPGGTPSSSTEQNPIIIYNSPGKFQSSLMAGNNKDTLVILGSDLIDVQIKPEAHYISLVSGSTVYFTNQSKYGVNYNWDFGDGNNSNVNSPYHQYNVEGEYFVKLISSNDCGSDTIIETIAVFLIPKIDFGSDTTIVCGSGNIQFISKTSKDVHNWSWQFDGGKPDVSDEKNPLVYYNKKGTYSVKLTVQNTNGDNVLVKQAYIKVISTVLCPDFVFHKTSDLSEVFPDPLKRYQSENPMVYPNPFSGNLQIHGSSNAEEIQVRLLDLLGREIYTEKLQVINGQFHKEMNFDYLKAGTYLINFNSTKDNITKTVFLSR